MHAMLHLQRQKSDATALGEERSRAGVYDENGEGKQVIRCLLEESQGNKRGLSPLHSRFPMHVMRVLRSCANAAAANALLTGELRRQWVAHPSRCVQKLRTSFFVSIGTSSSANGRYRIVPGIYRIRSVRAAIFREHRFSGPAVVRHCRPKRSSRSSSIGPSEPCLEHAW